MAAGSTYTPIATNTLSSTATSVTFSSIASTYTDLVLICQTTGASLDALVLQFNGDTATNYSTQNLYGSGTAASAGVDSNITYIYTGLSGTLQTQSIYNIMNYSNTTTYKTTLGTGDAPNAQLRTGVGLWRSTAAINSIKIFRTASSNMNIASTFTLYGIAAA